MVNGVLYIKTSMSQAAAIDAATGKTLWTFDPETWRRERPANTGYNSRGVAYWSDGKIVAHLPADRRRPPVGRGREDRPSDRRTSACSGAVDATQGCGAPCREPTTS